MDSAPAIELKGLTKTFPHGVRALDRVELDEETRRFIADRLWAGASLIVSDYGLSNEAGKYTDFIVQPR